VKVVELILNVRNKKLTQFVFQLVKTLFFCIRHNIFQLSKHPNERNNAMTRRHAGYVWDDVIFVLNLNSINCNGILTTLLRTNRPNFNHQDNRSGTG
jgi:hypothetical protein